MKNKGGEALDLTQFEKGTDEAGKAFTLALREIETVFEGKKSVTDKTKMAAVVVNGYAKLKGAEVHRMAMEIMVRKKLIYASAEFPALPEPR